MPIRGEQMNDRYDVLVKQLMEERNINEELKEKDQIRWVQEMKNIQQCVNEIIKSEYMCPKNIEANKL